MIKSSLFPNLADIFFAEKDPETILHQVLALYEQATGRTLARSDPVRLFIDAIILALVQQRNIIDFSAKMNLLAFSEGEYLDHLGALLGVKRLEGENDESLRERIQLAPESFSCAGPKEAYRYFAKTADPNIIDVAVMGPPDTKPGYVDIFPLMKGGALPSQAILDKVFAACNKDNVRPDTDFLTVKAPEVINFSLSLDFWIDENNASKASLIEEAAYLAVEDWCDWQRTALGRDINPSSLIHRLVACGVKRVDILEPTFTVIKDWQFASCYRQRVSYKGLEKQ